MVNFKLYDAENPQIWDAFVKYCFETKAKGFTKYSAKGIFEIIRWHSGMEPGNDGFKINNNYTPDYARKMMETYPEFDGFFVMRELKASRTPSLIGHPSFVYPPPPPPERMHNTLY